MLVSFITTYIHVLSLFLSFFHFDHGIAPHLLGF